MGKVKIGPKSKITISESARINNVLRIPKADEPIRQVNLPVYIDRIEEKIVEVPVYITKEIPVEIIKEVIVEKEIKVISEDAMKKEISKLDSVFASMTGSLIQQKIQIDKLETENREIRGLVEFLTHMENPEYDDSYLKFEVSKLKTQKTYLIVGLVVSISLAILNLI